MHLCFIFSQGVCLGGSPWGPSRYLFCSYFFISPEYCGPLDHLRWVWVGIWSLIPGILVLMGTVCPVGSSLTRTTLRDHGPFFPSPGDGLLALLFGTPSFRGVLAFSLGFWAYHGGMSSLQAGLDCLLCFIVLPPWWFLLLTDVDGLHKDDRSLAIKLDLLTPVKILFIAVDLSSL